MAFPIDLSKYRPLKLDISKKLSPEQKKQLKENIQLCRDTIVFFTAVAGAKGLGGHTGGAYDIVPEVMIAEGFMLGNKNIYPVHFDEAGHRVAIQYLLSVLHGDMKPEALLKYREFQGKLPGHPELGLTPGVKFSSGRLGHMWPFVNGIAKANPDKKIIIYGSDGSQQEGNDAEAARFAVSQNLNVKLIVDDNDVTIAGHPSRYIRGFNVAKTLEGHGMKTDVGDGEDIDALYARMQKAFTAEGPVALVNKRKMAIGIESIEGSPKGHDVIGTEGARAYLEKRGLKEAAAFLIKVEKLKHDAVYEGSSKETRKNRDEFGKIINSILEKMAPEERKSKVMVIDSDLEGSCGLSHIREKFPEVYVSAGIMERHNYSAAAGFGSEKGKQGIFATFSAFMEMAISEITMARLNHANVLAHFSHAGVDDMADNTCHFGINNFFAANGIAEHDNTRLYFPADALQMKAVLEKIFFEPGLRFIFSTRSATPLILKEDGSNLYENYKFTGKDEIIREGKDGYIVSYGEMLYRALDAVEQLKKQGMDVGLINKPLLNVVDEAMLKKLGKAAFILVVESQNYNTGLGIRFGTWLLERNLKPKYSHLGTVKEGQGGTSEQIDYQGLGPEGIMKKVLELKGDEK